MYDDADTHAVLDTNLIRDLLAVTTALESCSVRPVDDAFSLVLTLPVPSATTSHPLAAQRRQGTD